MANNNNNNNQQQLQQHHHHHHSLNIIVLDMDLGWQIVLQHKHI